MTAGSCNEYRGAYATAKVTDYVILRGQILQSRFTKLVSDETLPYLPSLYEAGRESSGAEEMYIRGILGWEMTDDPMTKDAQGSGRPKWS